MILRAGKDRRGFSLLELILVLSLLGLSSLIVLPAIEKRLKDREVRRSALGLAAVARDLRSKALHQGTPQQLTLNIPQNRYYVSREQEIDLPPDVRFSPVRGGETLNSGVRQFLFFPNGTALGGEIGFSVGQNPAFYSVRLEPLTGRIEVLRSQKQ
jgi:prepilin-type N-terminal cleavage/methylation domain-containing protein